MNDKSKIDELVKMLDAGMMAGVGHVNVAVDETVDQETSVQTMGCSDCSRNPMACSVPTLQQGLDDQR